jgi:ribosomal protein S18 acetylase RimI-like enzyme
MAVQASVSMQDITLIHVAKGSALPGNVKPIFNEASETIARLSDPEMRSQRQSSMDRALKGPCGALIFMNEDTPLGLICYEIYGDDIQMFFCHVLHSYQDKKADMFRTAVDELKKQFRVVRSNFNWPEPEVFSATARSMGFVVVERLSMSCKADAGHMVRPLPEGLKIVIYTPMYFETVAGMMCETSDQMDRVVNPLFTSVEGCKTLLGQMLGGTFGVSRPELTYVALQGDRLAGYLITASFTEGIVHIDDIAVDSAFRGKGLASAMIDRLIKDSGAAGNISVELAVTTSNVDALRLYRHKGFKITETFCQHIHVSNAENNL